jgi:hypothetical protein
MNAMNERDVEQHVSILGWMYIFIHSFFLVVAAFVLLLVTGVGLATEDPEARSVLLVVGPAVGVLLGALALPGLAAGYGLLTRQPWGRILAIVVGILGLVNFPLGTAVGLYACWVLFPVSARTYFAPHATANV